MKITEIVTEDSQLDEAGILRTIATPLARGAAKMFAPNARQVALDKVASLWARELRLHGSITTTAERILGKNNPLIKDSKFLKDAGKKAQQILSDADFAKSVQAVKTGVAATKAGTIETVKKSLAWANAIGWGSILYETYNKVDELNTLLESGKISPKEYDDGVRYYLGRVVTEMITVAIAGGVLKKGASIIGSIPILPYGEKLAAGIAKMTPQAKQAFLVWLATPASMGGGKEHFAQWYAGETFLPMVAKTARTWLGSWSLNAWRAIENQLGIEAPEGTKSYNDKTGTASNSQQSAASNELDDIAKLIPAATNDPNAMNFDMATGRWLNEPQKSK